MSNSEAPKKRKVGSAVRFTKGVGGAVEATAPIATLFAPLVLDYFKNLGTRDRVREEAEATLLGQLRRLAADRARGVITDEEFAKEATALLLAAPDAAP